MRQSTLFELNVTCIKEVNEEKEEGSQSVSFNQELKENMVEIKDSTPNASSSKDHEPTLVDNCLLTNTPVKSSLLTSPLDKQTKQAWHTCQDCRSSFLTQDLLEQHRVIHTGKIHLQRCFKFLIIRSLLKIVLKIIFALKN